MSDFVSVCKVGDIPDPGKQVVEVGERYVVMFHVDGRFYALDDLCTHDGGPLADGLLEGCEIECPRHGARFDVKTGHALSMPAIEPVTAHDVELREDGNYVAINE